jgi:hypothetical protein
MRKGLKDAIYSYIGMFDEENLDSVDIASGILSFKEFEQFDAEDVLECLHELAYENKIFKEDLGMRTRYKIIR